MAEAPAGGAGPGANNAQALIAKHAATTQAGSEADAATVARVEDAIKNSPMGWLQSMLGEVDSRATAERGQVQGKIAESNDLVSKNQAQAPADAGPPPAHGPAAHPAVTQPAVATAHTGPATPAPATGGTPAQHAPVAVAPPAKAAAPAAAPAPAPAPTIAAAVASAGSDSQLDGILNAYSPKAQETTQTLGRIKQMGDIAQGFNGQLDVYVAQGGAVEKGIAAAANAFGSGKEASAVWATNPYRNVHGILGGIMTGLSAVKNVCGVVGNICSKLGMVLTVIGLLGMIFPPIGVAVSGVARILNVVGVICEAVSFALSGVLTGLNGVVLAQQIAAGSSAEEKAATADLMMTEANDTASGFVNMAMTFGPKFMSGMLSQSRGVVSSLIRRAKAAIGRVSIKASGEVKLIANKVVRKLGLGGVGMERVGGAWKDTGLVARTTTAFNESRVGQVFNGAPAHLEAIQNKLMERYGNTAVARGLDRVGAWSGSVASKFDLEEKIGDLGERAGKKVGSAGAETAFGKRMAAAADQSELETRRLAMQMDAKDAAHLEETRWKRSLAARREANPDAIHSDAADQKFIASRGQRVRDDAAADFEAKEAKAATDARIDDLKQARMERHTDEYFENKTGFSGKSARDMQMDSLHGSREKRYALEGQFKAQDTERSTLLAKTARTADEDARLAALNTQLKPLDAARKINQGHETDLSAIASGDPSPRRPDYKNWGDVGKNAWEATSPALDFLDFTDPDPAWQAAEKGDLKKQLKFDKGKAKANAAGRGGHGTFAGIAATAQQNQIADFAAFVRSAPRTRSLASGVRGILAPITSKPASVPAGPVANAPVANPTSRPANANTNAPAPSAAPVAPVVSETMVVTPQVVDAGPPAPAEPAPAPTVASVAMAAMDDAAAQPLPYWPAMMPEFDHAQSDFGWMRKVAVEFKKAQIEGKQKAVDTLAVYGRYQEYAKLRAAAAGAHATATQTTVQSTQQNVTAAGQSEQHGAQGEAKQGEARGAANDRAATDLPEPESRGFWGRILGAVKRWAKDKASQVFGWIQEKIASVVLKGLCGVSMGDMKEYAGALKRQQAAAHGVATGAGTTATQAQSTAIKLGADATKEAQSAADAVGECDRNITDVDNFMSDVATFEQQLAEEKAFAQSFLAQLHAEVAAQQAKKKADDAAEAAMHARASAAGRATAASGGGVGDVAIAAMHATAATPAAAASAAAPAAAPAPAPEPAPVADTSDASTIHSAASYVEGQAESLNSQLETRADDYQNQLKVALTNHTGKDSQGEDLRGPSKKASKTIVEEFKTVAQHTKTDMNGFTSMSIDPSAAHKIADTIIQSADHLEDAFGESEHALDNLFERTYAGIRDGQRTLKSRLLDGNNVTGDMNHAGDAVTNHAIDGSLPTMTVAWNDVAAPIQRKASGPAAEADPAHVAQAAQRGIGAGSPLPHMDRIQRAFGDHDISGIRAHTGDNANNAAQSIGARAYTTGDNVVLGAGGGDLHTVAHEAAHVVQQREGVHLKAGLDGGSSDPYEQHADAVADAVVAGKSAAPLLDQVKGGRGADTAAVQRASTKSADTTSTTATPTETVDDPAPGINKAGFVDNSEGANVNTRPREAGGKPLTATPLPPATRVFVSGTHPSAPEWLYVTAFPKGQSIVRGYMQVGRVNTDLPEPQALLHQIIAGDTPEGIAKTEYGQAVRDGHDLRYYENVLLYVNRQAGRDGITGTFQDPGVLGGGANNIQLVAGKRIWLVTPDFAHRLEGVVPDGSLTGGAYAKVKRFAHHIEDLIGSVTEAPSHLGEVGKEVGQAIHDHMAQIIGVVAGFIAAEATSAFLAATPTGVGQLAAYVIQLALALFNAAGAVEAAKDGVGHASNWLTKAWTANGNAKQVSEASSEFVRMLVDVALAALSVTGAKANLGKALQIADHIAVPMTPALAVANGGTRAGVGTGVMTGVPGPAGPVGTGVTMMTGDERSGSGDTSKAEQTAEQKAAAEKAAAEAEQVAKLVSELQAKLGKDVVARLQSEMPNGLSKTTLQDALKRIPPDELAQLVKHNGVDATVKFGPDALKHVGLSKLEQAARTVKTSISDAKIQKKWKHASDFGVTTPWKGTDAAAQTQFRDAINEVATNADSVYVGPYHQEAWAIHFFKGGKVVVADLAGEFISGWANAENKLAGISAASPPTGVANFRVR